MSAFTQLRIPAIKTALGIETPRPAPSVPERPDPLGHQPREPYAKQRRAQCLIIPPKLGMPLTGATLSAVVCPRVVMGGDEAALLRLWREKRGEAEPENLSDNLIVQLGLYQPSDWVSLRGIPELPVT